MSKKNKQNKKPLLSKKTKGFVKKAAVIGLTGGVGAAVIAAKSKKGKKVIAKLKKGVKTGGDKLHKALVKTVGKAKDIPFAPLLPFKKVMINGLKKRGVSHSNDLSDIVPKFYHSVVKHNFQSVNNSYNVDGNEMIYVDHVDFKGVAGSVAKTGTGGGAVNVAAQLATGNVVGGVSTLVGEILTYLRRLKDKKDKQAQELKEGKEPTDPLTEEESKILDGAENTAKQLQDVAKEEVENSIAMQVKEFMFSWKGGVVLLVIVVLIYMASRRKK